AGRVPRSLSLSRLAASPVLDMLLAAGCGTVAEERSVMDRAGSADGGRSAARGSTSVMGPMSTTLDGRPTTPRVAGALSQPAAVTAGAPAGPDRDSGVGEPERGVAVVVAMKPQLRGRVRRNVETLLEMGFSVVVISVVTRKEFFVGLTSPRLEAHFL